MESLSAKAYQNLLNILMMEIYSKKTRWMKCRMCVIVCSLHIGNQLFIKYRGGVQFHLVVYNNCIVIFG